MCHVPCDLKPKAHQSALQCMTLQADCMRMLRCQIRKVGSTFNGLPEFINRIELDVVESLTSTHQLQLQTSEMISLSLSLSLSLKFYKSTINKVLHKVYHFKVDNKRGSSAISHRPSANIHKTRDAHLNLKSQIVQIAHSNTQIIK